MKLLILFSLYGFFFMKPRELVTAEGIMPPLPGPPQVERELPKAGIEVRAQELEKMKPLKAFKAGVPGPSITLLLDENGTLSGMFNDKNIQVFGKKGIPDVEAFKEWLKTKPKNSVNIIRPHKNAPRELLKEVLNSLTQAGMETIRIQ